MQPPRVIATRLLFWSQGFCLFPWLVFVRPERKDDAALIAHETVHCQQMRRVGTLRFWLAYLFDEGFRFDAEVQAYRVQAKLQPWNLNAFAASLATNYHLDITYDEALEALTTQGGAR